MSLPSCTSAVSLLLTLGFLSHVHYHCCSHAVPPWLFQLCSHRSLLLELAKLILAAAASTLSQPKAKLYFPLWIPWMNTPPCGHPLLLISQLSSSPFSFPCPHLPWPRSGSCSLCILPDVSASNHVLPLLSLWFYIQSPRACHSAWPSLAGRIWCPGLAHSIHQQMSLHKLMIPKSLMLLFYISNSLLSPLSTQKFSNY